MKKLSNGQYIKLTDEEKARHAAKRKAWEEGADHRRAMEELNQSEAISKAARKLEEVIDHLVNGVELSSYTKEWLEERKTAREQL